MVPYLLIFCTLLFWSSAFVVIRYLARNLDPMAIATLRLLIAGTIMAAYVAYSRARLGIRPGDLAGLAVLGVIGLAVYNVGLMIGEVTLDAGTAAFIISQTPVFSAIFAVLFVGEALYLTSIIGMALCMGGVTLIYLSRNDGDVLLNAGVLWVLVAAIAQSFYFVLQKKYLKRYSAHHITAYGMIGAALPALFLLPFLGADFSTLSVQDIALISYLAIFASLLAYFMWTKALQNLSVIKVTNMLYLLPLFTILQSLLFLNEIPSGGKILGGVLGLSGAILVQKGWSLGLGSRMMVRRGR